MHSGNVRFAFKGPSPLFVFDPGAMTDGLSLALATGSILHATAVESVEVAALARNANRSLQSLSGDAAHRGIRDLPERKRPRLGNLISLRETDTTVVFEVPVVITFLAFAGIVNNEKENEVKTTKRGQAAWFTATTVIAPLFVLGFGLLYSSNARRRKSRPRPLEKMS